MCMLLVSLCARILKEFLFFSESALKNAILEGQREKNQKVCKFPICLLACQVFASSIKGNKTTLQQLLCVYSLLSILANLQ